MMEIALDLLSQFTGTGGGVKHALVNFGVAAIFWALLLGSTRLASRRPDDRLALVFTLGFGFALSRELLMLGVKVLDAYQVFSPEQLHLVFPPLEHALSGVGLAFIAGAYTARLSGNTEMWLRFTKFSVIAVSVTYVATAAWWLPFSAANPEIRFGQTWTDWAFRIVASIILGVATIAIARAESSRTRNVVGMALTMFFANEFLKIIDMAYAEQYESTFATIRHSLFLLALPLLTYAYMREQAIRLDSVLRDLEETVAERTNELAGTVALLEESNVELQRLSTTDPLTGAANRKAFDDELESAWHHGLRSKSPISLMLIDLDHFKSINDEHGHIRGDEALKVVATCLRVRAKRHTDFVARFGGDEFVVLQPHTELENSQTIAEEIRLAVADLDEGITVSIGTATMIPSAIDSPTDLIHQADLGLFKAKREGRDRVATAV